MEKNLLRKIVLDDVQGLDEKNMNPILNSDSKLLNNDEFPYFSDQFPSIINEEFSIIDMNSHEMQVNQDFIPRSSNHKAEILNWSFAQAGNKIVTYLISLGKALQKKMESNVLQTQQECKTYNNIEESLRQSMVQKKKKEQYKQAAEEKKLALFHQKVNYLEQLKKESPEEFFEAVLRNDHSYSHQHDIFKTYEEQVNTCIKLNMQNASTNLAKTTGENAFSIDLNTLGTVLLDKNVDRELIQFSSMIQTKNTFYDDSHQNLILQAIDPSLVLQGYSILPTPKQSD